MSNMLSRILLVLGLIFSGIACQGVPSGEALRYSGGDTIPVAGLVSLALEAGSGLMAPKEAINPDLAKPAVLYRAEPPTPGKPMKF
jgi:hypothetical protein